MTRKEEEELKELGKTTCPCFCAGNKDLDELMTMNTAPNYDHWSLWIQKEELQAFVQKFFPEFRVKMNRFVELYLKKDAEKQVDNMAGFTLF
jgi:hypothetical protein